MAITSVFGLAGLTGGGTFGDLEITLDGALPLDKGGTGYTTSGPARANLFTFLGQAIGDMYYRSATGTPGTLQRIELGPAGYVLTVNASRTAPQWSPAPGGGPGGGAVDSVFTRTGSVVAMTGDYNVDQVTNAVSTQGSYPDPAWITSLAWSKVSPSITGSPSASTFLRGDGVWASPPGGPGGTTPTFEIDGSAIGSADTLNFIPGDNIDLDGSFTSGRVDITISAAAAEASTPWTEDVDADRYNLLHVGQISTQYLTFCNDADPALDVSMIGGRLDVDAPVNAEGIGIGTPAIKDAITLQTSGSLVAGFRHNDTGGGFSGYQADNDESQSIRMVVGGSEQPIFQMGIIQTQGTTPLPLSFWTAGAEHMRITTAGNVGIGTEEPGHKLVVVGDVESFGDFFAHHTIRVGAHAQGATAGDLALSRDSNPQTGAIYFGNTGNHFISFDGTDYSLSSNAHIIGDVHIDGRLFVNGVEVHP